MNNLKRNIRNSKSFNFKTFINIQKEKKINIYQLILKIVQEKNKIDQNSNLKINIKVQKLEIIIDKYPMNFCIS